MKRALAVILMGAALLSGCKSATQIPPDNATPGAGDAAGQAAGDKATSSSTTTIPPSAAAETVVVATVRGDDVTMKDLQGPLVEAYGLPVLLELVQLDLAKQEAARQNISIAPEDVQNEETLTLLGFRKASHQEETTTAPSESDGISPEDHAKLLNQLLTNQRITPAEFNLTMQTNAYLRKLVVPIVQPQITDALVKDRFNAIYGEKARIRYVRFSDMLAVSKLQKELAAGKTFEQEVRFHAYDTAGRPSAGEPPPFSRQDIHYPGEFREATFGLQPGQVSDPVKVGDSIFVIQLVDLIPPQHARFDDYKDSVRQDVYAEAMQAGVAEYRQKLGVVALNTMEIKEPTLRREWQDRLDKTTKGLHAAEELKKKLQKEQDAATTEPGK